MKLYQDTEKGAKAALQEMCDPDYLDQIDKAIWTPDPCHIGVWLAKGVSSRHDCRLSRRKADGDASSHEDAGQWRIE